MKKTVCFILLLSILLNGCASTSAVSSGNPAFAAQEERQQEIDEIVVGSCTIILITWIVLIIHALDKNKEKRQAAVKEGKN